MPCKSKKSGEGGLLGVRATAVRERERKGYLCRIRYKISERNGAREGGGGGGR
jgi:hypothetical protein